MSEIDKNTVIKKLQEKNVTLPCSRCRNNNFTVLENTSLTIQSDLTKQTLGGKNIPVAMVACTNCGNVSLHALGALGLLTEKGEGNK